MDEVLVDLLPAWVKGYNSLTPGNGRQYVPIERIKHWDLPGRWHDWQSVLDQPGLIACLPWEDEYAKEVLATWRDLGHDVFLVSAATSGTVAHGKFEWVEREMISKGLLPSHRHLVIASAKFLVTGDVMIDDKISNLVGFKTTNPHGLPILYSKPWNKNYDLPESTVVSSNWREIEEAVNYYSGQPINV